MAHVRSDDDKAGIGYAGNRVTGSPADHRAGTAIPAGPFRDRSTLLWALAGFVIGAGFWHLVGFWSFMSGVVLQGPEQRIVLPKLGPAGTRIANCSAFAINRRTGAATTEPCPRGDRRLQEAHQGRKDYARIAEGRKDAKSPSGIGVPTAKPLISTVAEN